MMVPATPAHRHPASRPRAGLLVEDMAARAFRVVRAPATVHPVALASLAARVGGLLKARVGLDGKPETISVFEATTVTPRAGARGSHQRAAANPPPCPAGPITAHAGAGRAGERIAAVGPRRVALLPRRGQHLRQARLQALPAGAAGGAGGRGGQGRDVSREWLEEQL